MEWLSQLSAGQVVQGGAAISVVLSAVWYVVRFQKTFTDRLEKQGQKDEERIDSLGKLVDEERRARRQAETDAALKVDEEVRLRRRAEQRLAECIYLMHAHGVEVPPETPLRADINQQGEDPFHG